MITPARINDISNEIATIYAHISDELLVNIGKHITSPNWTHTASWEIQKLAELGQLTQENAAIINKWIKAIPPELRNAMEETRKAALDEIEKQMDAAAKRGYVAPPVTDSTVAVFQDMQAQAADRLNLVNTTMLQSSVDQYQRAVVLTQQEYDKLMAQREATQEFLNDAAMSTATGVETRRVAVRRAIGRISAEGLTGFIDRAGRHWTPEAYVNMDVRTTVHNTAIQATRARMNDFGTSVFQVSSHAGARPLCYPYQGKFYSWDNTAGTIELGDGSVVAYEALSSTSYGQPAGLFGINCGHYPIPIIAGITIPHGADNIQPEEENDKAYALSQEQRALERKIREAKRLVEMAGDTATPEDKQKVKDAQAQMRAFIEKTGRTRRYDREQIGGTPQTKAPVVPKAPEPEQTTIEPVTPQRAVAPAFTPATSISEAEEFARQYMQGGKYSKIDYSRIDLEYANEFNRAFNDVLSVYTPNRQLLEIMPMNKREKAFQGTTAEAAYQWFQNKLFFNADYFKNPKAYAKHRQQYFDLLNQVMPNIDILIEQKKNDTGFGAALQNAYLRALKATGRTNVSATEAYGTMVHELGHYLDDTVFRAAMKERGFDVGESYRNFSEGVSGYATQTNREYVAESFLAYWNGERDNLDPALVSIFEDMRK